jgi:rRNA maturation endonuclease Nob1
MALPEGALPLVVGTALVLGALTLVLSPLLSAIDPATDTPAKRKAVKLADEIDAPSTAVDALREIEFDRETGKLSESDYADLKQRYTREALAELRAAEQGAGATTAGAATATASVVTAGLDPVEAAIARARADVRSCGVCGPRPEPDATYCSSCGRYLPEKCGSCGTSIDLVGSRFCSGCGDQLAAA